MRATPMSAGFDIRSIDDYILPAGGMVIINTGLKIELPEGCYGRIAPRSGLAVKHSINIGGNMIRLNLNQN